MENSKLALKSATKEAVTSYLQGFCQQWTKQHLHFDDTRQDFVKSIAKAVLRLYNGKQYGKNCFRKLLLGVIGAGKSALLDALQDGLRELNDNNLIVCTHSYYNGGMIRATDAIVQELGRSSKQFDATALPAGQAP